MAWQSGKAVSIVAQPLTVIGAFAFMPSVKNDIAIGDHGLLIL